MLGKVTAYSSIESFRAGRRLLRRCAPRNDREARASRNDRKGHAPRNGPFICHREPRRGVAISLHGDCFVAALLAMTEKAALLAMTEKATPPRNEGREGTPGLRRTSKPSFPMEEES